MGRTGAEQDFYSRTGLAIFLFTMAASSAWAVYFTVFHNSIDLGEMKAGPPMPKMAAQEESPEAEGKTEPSAESEASGAEGEGEAWISTDKSIAQGAAVYKIHCAVCHGPKGLGDGTPGLVPPPRNLVEGDWKRGGSSKELFITLQEGIEGGSMVSFKHLSKEDRWALAHYIRSITKNKVKDELEELEEFAKTAL